MKANFFLLLFKRSDLFEGGLEGGAYEELSELTLWRLPSLESREVCLTRRAELLEWCNWACC